ncbi:hypothetical protein KAH55_07695 [bacterium]|nr:hypothetical protein [bacterium]
MAAASPVSRSPLGHPIYPKVARKVDTSPDKRTIRFIFVLGMAIGVVFGYASGHIDNVIQRIIKIMNFLLRIPLWIALSAVRPADWHLCVSTSPSRFC